MPAHCLIVDDEPGVQKYLAQVLSQADVTSETCSHPAAMRDAVLARRPDMIFLDAALLNSDAVKALRALAEVSYDGPIQLISGRGSDVLSALHQSGCEKGLSMMPPLSKPVRVTQLREVLHIKGLTEQGTGLLGKRTEWPSHPRWEIWSKCLFDVNAQTLSLVELRPRTRDAEYGQSLRTVEGFPQTSEQLRLLIGQCRQSYLDYKHDGRLGATAVSAVIPIRLQQIADEIDEALDRLNPEMEPPNWLTIEMPEDDILLDVRSAAEIMLQFRIRGVRIRVRAASLRLSTHFASEKLPVQEVTFSPDPIFRGRSGSLKALGGFVDVIHHAGAKALAGPVSHPSDLAWFAAAGFDLFEERGCELSLPSKELLERFGGLPSPIRPRLHSTPIPTRRVDCRV